MGLVEGPNSRRLVADAPGGAPVVGHIPAFLWDKLAFLERCARRPGAAVRIALDRDVFLLKDPADVHDVLVDQARLFEKVPGIGAAGLFGESLLGLEDSSHLDWKRTVMRAYRGLVCDSFARAVEAAAERQVAAWVPGVKLDIRREMFTLAQEAFLAVLFGPLDPDERRRLRWATGVRLAYLEHAISASRPWAGRWPLKAVREWPRAEAALDRFITERLVSPDKGTLLALLKDAAGHPARAGSLAAEVRSLTVAGYEPVGEMLSWTCGLLAQYPHIQERVRREVLGIVPTGPIPVSCLKSLPYTGAVLSESLRLYPPTWLFVRVAREQHVLPSGVEIPAKSRVYLSPWAFHRSAHHFPDPKRFRPERFEEGATLPLRQGYFPFGGGPRACVGEEFVRMEGQLVLATVLRSVRLDAVRRSLPRPVARTTTAPARPLMVRVGAVSARQPERSRLARTYSLVIPTHNRPRQVVKMLDGILALDADLSQVEVILVDDGSATPVAEIARPYESRLRLTVLRQANQGPAPARQAGIAQATGAVVAFLDDDCVPHPLWLKTIDETLTAHPGCAVGGRSVNGLPSHLLSEASQLLLEFIYDRFNSDPDRGTFFTTNNVAFPREEFARIGGLDTTWHISGGEDRDLCRRWTETGRRLVFSDQMVIYHSHALSLKSYWRQHFNYGRGAYKYRAMARRRSGSTLAWEPLGFYLALLLYPLRRCAARVAFPLALLFLISQLATTVGYTYQRVTGNEGR